MEFYSKYCNICFKEENLLNISTGENAGLLNTLITLIGQPEMESESSVYLCSCCCNKLEDINIFRDMCIKNFIQFRKSCHDLKKLKNNNDPDITEKIKIFLRSKIKNESNCVEDENLERIDCDSMEVEDREIELEKVFIKEEPEDMLPENETIDYNTHNLKIESEIDLGTTSYEVEPNSFKTYNLDVKKYISSGEINNENPLGNPKRKAKRKNGEIANYVCNICKKTFPKLYNLVRHQSIHTGQKPYRCNLCNKTFCDSTNLKIHQRQHTGEKPYKCDKCDKSYIDISTFKRHCLIHTGVKPHECDICHKSFVAVSCLNRHRLVHSLERPHKCNVCKKSFQKLSYLKIHRLFHTGEKPYECDICHKKFTMSSNLNRHRAIHSR